MATGLQVQLPGWNFPVVCDLGTGKAHYDNYGGQWGRVGETCFSLLTLEVYYRHLPLFKRNVGADPDK